MLSGSVIAQKQLKINGSGALEAGVGGRLGWSLVPFSVGHLGCTPTPRLSGGFKRTALCVHLCGPAGRGRLGSSVANCSHYWLSASPLQTPGASCRKRRGLQPSWPPPWWQERPRKVAVPGGAAGKARLASWSRAVWLIWPPVSALPGQSHSASLSLGLSVGAARALTQASPALLDQERDWGVLRPHPSCPIHGVCLPRPP